MSRTLNVVVVNGSPSLESKTVGLATVVTDALAGVVPISVHRIDVYRLGPGFTDALSRDDVAPEVERELLAVESADVVIAATPVFRASYSGMFKHFFDLVDPYGLVNALVVLVATGGSERHALVIEHALRPLFGFFQAATMPVGFYANSGDFDGVTVLNAEVYSRVQIGIEDVRPRLLALTEAEPVPRGAAEPERLARY